MTSQLQTSIYRGYHPVSTHRTESRPMARTDAYQQYVAISAGVTSTSYKGWKGMSFGQFVDWNNIDLVEVNRE